MQLGVPSMRRQIFLDNDTSERALEKQFQLIITQSKQQGKLIAIAHPYPETIRFLNANLARLNDNGITLLPTSQLFDDLNVALSTQPTPPATLR